MIGSRSESRPMIRWKCSGERGCRHVLIHTSDGHVRLSRTEAQYQKVDNSVTSFVESHLLFKWLPIPFPLTVATSYHPRETRQRNHYRRLYNLQNEVMIIPLRPVLIQMLGFSLLGQQRLSCMSLTMSPIYRVPPKLTTPKVNGKASVS